MAAQKQDRTRTRLPKTFINEDGETITLREFVVRLEQPGLYDRLFDKSVEMTKDKGRRVPMTEIVRVALEKHLK